MKTMITRTIVQLEEKDLREFRSVNETLATNLFFPQPPITNKNFGVVDLWKCRNKRRMNGITIR
jgi:hypothetical protein